MRLSFNLTAFALLIVIPSGALARPPEQNLLPNGDDAVAVVKVILEARNGKAWLNRRLLDQDLKVESQGDSWMVYFFPKGPPARSVDENGNEMITVTAGGGLPEITISKRDAQVTDFHYSR